MKEDSYLERLSSLKCLYSNLPSCVNNVNNKVCIKPCCLAGGYKIKWKNCIMISLVICFSLGVDMESGQYLFSGCI